MVLEAVVNPRKALDFPLKAFFAGLLYAFSAAALAGWVFKGSQSIVMVAFASLMAAPFMYVLIMFEENLAEKHPHFLLQYKRLFWVLAMLVFGLIAGFFVWFFMTGDASYFTEQAASVQSINGSATLPGHFMDILLNNLRVLIITIIFSLLLGLGGIFVIAWNASVVAYALGDLVTKIMSWQFSFVTASSLAGMYYLLHGIPELVAYFVAGVAASMLSAAIVRGHLSIVKYDGLWKEVGQLFAFSLLILIGAAMIEAYFIPLLF